MASNSSSRTGSPTISPTTASCRTNTLTSQPRHSPPSSLRRPPPIIASSNNGNCPSAPNRSVSFASTVPPTPRKQPTNRSNHSFHSNYEPYYCEKCSSLNSNSGDAQVEDVVKKEKKKPGIVGNIFGAVIYVLCVGCVIGGDTKGRGVTNTRKVCGECAKRRRDNIW